MGAISRSRSDQLLEPTEETQRTEEPSLVSLFRVALSTEGEEAAYDGAPLHTTYHRVGVGLQAGADAEGLSLTLMLEQAHVCVQSTRAHA